MTIPVISVRPVVLPAPGRGEDLQLRVSAPAAGTDLPVIVFSHGFGESMDGYAPLAVYWAANGFVVVQPTHLDSRTLNVTPDDARYPEIWRFRVEDLSRTLDHLDAVEDAVPGLAGRIDRDRIAAAGHSWGAQSVSMLLGARVLGATADPQSPGATADPQNPGATADPQSPGATADPQNPGAASTLDPRALATPDPRVRAGVLLAVPGTGGADLTPFAAEHFPFMNPDFASMTTPTLVVAGDKDQSALSVRGPEWFTDAYRLSPGAKSLLTLFGAEHSLGGITGYQSTETTDESPERVDAVRRLTAAFLRSALDPSDSGWAAASAEPQGRIDSK
ncbi:alpha/beta hydrolase family protein [Actinoplanes sp. NPDC051513]|uniref:alpha/beta hydrolase family protein n=1 Tax=Actinoplanes sp. NPDC051513 TaxID=3363908 RepID=UPI0037A5F3B1